jgi:predicted PurR-regulated permease PerM
LAVTLGDRAAATVSFTVRFVLDPTRLRVVHERFGPDGISVQSILAPIFMAVVLVICVYPLRAWLLRKGTPGWLAMLLLVLTIYAILIGPVLAFVVGLTRFAALLPQYRDQMTATIEHFKNGLADLEIDMTQSRRPSRTSVHRLC